MYVCIYMNDTDTAERFTPSLSRQRSVQTVRHFCFDTGACQCLRVLQTHDKCIYSRVIFPCCAYSRTTEAALNICKYKPAAACYAVSHAANFPRPNLDLPRGFSCYWRDAQPSCRLHASHTSADSTYDNHLFHVRHKV